MTPDEERLLDQLADGLAAGGAGPSEERVAAVRAHAARRREEAARRGADVVALPERRGRREVLTGAVAAAAGVVLGTVGSEVLGADQPPSAPTEPVELAVATPGIDAGAVSIDHTWGVEIILTATGLAPGAVYRAAVQPADGTADVAAGSFLGVDGVAVVCRMNASIVRAAAASFTVVDEQGATVITGVFEA